jgi:hypothetical protein
MYPSGELAELANRKARLQRRIGLTRLHCAAEAAVIAKPIGLFDRTVQRWRKIAPIAKIAAVPLGLLLRRRLMPKPATSLIGQALKWMPAVMSAARMFSSRDRSA